MGVHVHVQYTRRNWVERYVGANIVLWHGFVPLQFHSAWHGFVPLQFQSAAVTLSQSTGSGEGHSCCGILHKLRLELYSTDQAFNVPRSRVMIEQKLNLTMPNRQ